MKEFKIHCSWRVCGTLYIQAETLEEAEEIALTESPLPIESEYLDDSFTLDREIHDYGESVEVE